MLAVTGLTVLDVKGRAVEGLNAVVRGMRRVADLNIE
jgi:hypothetical protein